MKRKALAATSVFVVVIVSVALFRAKSWSQINYSPTDGKTMLRELDRKTEDYQGSYTAKFAHEKAWASWKPGEDNKRVCIYFYRFRSVLPLPGTNFVRELFGKKSILLDFSGASAEVSSTYSHWFNLNTNSDQSYFENEKAMALFDRLENNTPLKLNEDFVSVETNHGVRVYSFPSLPANVRSFMKMCAIKGPLSSL